MRTPEPPVKEVRLRAEIGDQAFEGQVASVGQAVLRSADGQSLLFIAVEGYEKAAEDARPYADLYQNVVLVRVPAMAVGFNQAVFHAASLEGLISGLQSFIQDISMTRFEWLPPFPYCTLTMRRNYQLKVLAEGCLHYPVTLGNRLSFSFETNALMISRFADHLQKALGKYPARFQDQA